MARKRGRGIMETIYYYTNEDWTNLELFEKRRGKVHVEKRQGEAHAASFDERKRKLQDRLLGEEE